MQLKMIYLYTNGIQLQFVGKTRAGSGAYMKGTIDASGFIDRYLTVKVGNISNIAESSSATYLSIYVKNNNNYGQLLAIAGAGGNMPYNSRKYIDGYGNIGLGSNGGDAGWDFSGNITKETDIILYGITNSHFVKAKGKSGTNIGGTAGMIDALENADGISNTSFNGNNPFEFTDVKGGSILFRITWKTKAWCRR